MTLAAYKGRCPTCGWQHGAMCDPNLHPTPDVTGYAALIQYPEHWDTAAYPTLESAVREVLAWAGCAACKQPGAYGMVPSS